MYIGIIKVSHAGQSEQQKMEASLKRLANAALAIVTNV
jgi:hypothetical protein